jgi:hypothetical protein
MKSRIYYYKKHFGFMTSMVIEMFARFSKWHALLLVALLIGATIRLYDIPGRLVFNGEIGDNYLAIKDLLTHGTFPLLGPPTSHPWLYFGPLFYILFGPILLMAKFDPVVGGYIFAVVGIFTLIINYLVVSKMFNKSIGLVSTYLIGISPLWIIATREARFFSLVIIFFYPFYYSLYKKKYFLSGLFFGLMLNFHYSPLIFIPYIIYIARRKVAVFILGIILPNVFFLIYNMKNGFDMISKLFIWIPYRVMGFMGVTNKNNFNIKALIGDLHSFYQFVTKTFIGFDIKIVGIIVFIIFLVFVIKNFKIHQPLLILGISSLILLFIHGYPPSHYYFPLYPLAILIFSFGIVKLKKELVIILLLILTIINVYYIFGLKSKELVAYKLQIRVADAIINNARGQKYVLSRVGPGDEFDGNYAQNYIYLLWWKGNEPSDEGRLRYTIYEGRKDNANKEDVIFKEDGIIVTNNIIKI